MKNRIRLAVFFVCCAISCFCDVAAWGLAVQRAETRALLPEVSLEREIAGADEHHYAIRLTSGQSVTLRLVKQGIALTSTIKNPAQQELFPVVGRSRDVLSAQRGPCVTRASPSRTHTWQPGRRASTCRSSDPHY